MNVTCEGCARILQVGEGFCTFCGRPRPGDSPSELPEVLAILPQAQYCKGFLGFGSSMNILVLTREHLLVAEVSKSMEALISAMDEELEESFRQGDLEAHEFMKSRDFSQAPWQSYRRRPLRESRQDNPNNRLLEMASIQKVEVAMYDGWNDDTLTLHLAKEKIKFVFWWPLGVMAMEAFRQVLGDKVHDVS